MPHQSPTITPSRHDAVSACICAKQKQYNACCVVTQPTKRQMAERLQAQAMLGSSFQMARTKWADLDVELLLDIFTRADFYSKLACELVCTSWRQVLARSAARGLWGENWSLFANAARVKVQEGSSGVDIALPKRLDFHKGIEVAYGLSRRSAHLQTLCLTGMSMPDGAKWHKSLLLWLVRYLSLKAPSCRITTVLSMGEDTMSCTHPAWAAAFWLAMID